MTDTAAALPALCERLADAYARKGVDVRANLAPGLDPEVVRAAWAGKGIEAPPELLALYAWRNGHVDEFGDALLVFRDNTLLSLERALEEYDILADPGNLDTGELYGVDLEKCIPVAAYEGCVYALATGRHPWGGAPAPVVQVFEDLDRYFLSLPHMLETAAAWVEHREWSRDGMDPDAQMEVWLRLNPGVFPENDDDE